jgi:hypothetical protein
LEEQPRRRRPQWIRLAFVAIGAAALTFFLAHRMAVPPGEAGPLHRYWVEGTVERVSIAPSGAATITVTAVNGRPTTATIDLGRTSVFYAQDGVAHTGHLTAGQAVRLMHERGVAKSIEILPQATFRAGSSIPFAGR